MQSEGSLVEIEVNGNTVVVSGEVDINTAPAVEEALLECLQKGNTSLTIDLSRVTYFDSSGIQALLTAREAMGDKQGPIRLIGLNTHTNRVFRLVGLERFFEMEPTAPSVTSHQSLP